MKKAILFFGVLVMSLTSISCSTEDYDIEQVESDTLDVNPQIQNGQSNSNDGNNDSEQDEDGQPVQGTKKD